MNYDHSRMGNIYTKRVFLETAMSNFLHIFSFLDPENKETGAKPHIEWAMDTLKRDDRINWYLNHVKIVFLDRLVRNNKYTELERSYFHKELVRTKEMFNYDSTSNLNIQSIQGFLEHFFSLGIDEIDNYQFKNQNVHQVRSDLMELENKFSSSMKEYQDISDEQFVEIKSFGDVVWFEDDKGSSSIISLVEIKRHNDKTYGKKLLSYILDHDGFLGELNGQVNNNINENVKYLLSLLMFKTQRGYLIKGLKGDISRGLLRALEGNIQKKLFSLRPELMPLSMQYEQHGITNQLKQSLSKIYDDFIDVIDKGEQSVIKFSAWRDVTDFINNIPDGQASTRLKELYPQLSKTNNQTKEVDKDDLKEFFVKICEESQQFSEIALDEYDQVEHQITSYEELFEYLINKGSGLIQDFHDAYKRGMMVGSRGGMIKHFKELMNDLVISHYGGEDDSITFFLDFDKLNQPINLECGLEEFLNFAEFNGDMFDQPMREVVLDLDFEGSTADDTYYGFDGFDMDAAKKYLTKVLVDKGR
jgi:hypothetical protein